MVWQKEILLLSCLMKNLNTQRGVFRSKKVLFQCSYIIDYAPNILFVRDFFAEARHILSTG